MQQCYDFNIFLRILSNKATNLRYFLAQVCILLMVTLSGLEGVYKTLKPFILKAFSHLFPLLPHSKSSSKNTFSDACLHAFFLFASPFHRRRRFYPSFFATSPKARRRTNQSLLPRRNVALPASSHHRRDAYRCLSKLFL